MDLKHALVVHCLMKDDFLQKAIDIARTALQTLHKQYMRRPVFLLGNKADIVCYTFSTHSKMLNFLNAGLCKRLRRFEAAVRVIPYTIIRSKRSQR